MSAASSASRRLTRPPVAVERPTALRVGGLTSLSTSDWPGQLAAVVFCQGCPWRCGYCHNPHLLPSHAATEIAWDDVVAFLDRRRGLLDAVVYSGGEPLAQTTLDGAMRVVKRMGFRIGLHTGGAYPARLAQLLPLIDWVGFDIKAAFVDYPLITAVPGSGDNALSSARLVIESGVAHEFRTTVHPSLHQRRGLERLAERLAELGVANYVLQEFRAQGCANAHLTRDMPRSLMTDSFCATIAANFESFAVRRG